MSKRPTQTEDKYVLRLPDGMRGRLKTAAEANNRSMNAEIVDRLEWSFDSWPIVKIDADIKARALTYSQNERKDYEKQLQTYASDLAEIRFPKVDPEIVRAFNKLTEFVVLMPTERQGELADAIRKIMQIGHVAPPDSEIENDDEWPGF